MKYLFTLPFLYFFLAEARSEGFLFPGNTWVEGTVVVRSEHCLVVEQIGEDGNTIYWVLAEIANALLPDASRVVCLQVLGEDNEDICNAIANGVDFLTNFIGAGTKVWKLSRIAAEMTANRRNLDSSLRFVAQSIDVALSIKNTVEAYHHLGIINWNAVKQSHEIIRHNVSIGEATFENLSTSDYTLEFSRDGYSWTSLTIPGRTYQKIAFWKGQLKQNYGYCKGMEICKYQVYVDKTYQIRQDNYSQEFFIHQK